MRRLPEPRANRSWERRVWRPSRHLESWSYTDWVGDGPVSLCQLQVRLWSVRQNTPDRGTTTWSLISPLDAGLCRQMLYKGKVTLNQESARVVFVHAFYVNSWMIGSNCAVSYVLHEHLLTHTHRTSTTGQSIHHWCDTSSTWRITHASIAIASFASGSLPSDYWWMNIRLSNNMASKRRKRQSTRPSPFHHHSPRSKCKDARTGRRLTRMEQVEHRRRMAASIPFQWRLKITRIKTWFRGNHTDK